MGKKIDLTGQTYGRWLVLNEEGRSKSGDVLWRCKCTCRLGTVRVVRGSDLRNEKSQSCGCLMRELASERETTHGMTKSRLYHIWANILHRAGIYKGSSEKTKRLYQERGITVCDEWLVFENFRDWALSNGYADGLQIDRIDNEKGYCPENCHWVTCKENCNNRRCTARLEDGKSLAMFCSEIGIQTCENGKTTNVYNRIYMAFKKGKIHPELLAKANEYLNLLKKVKASLCLLGDIREFRHGYKVQHCDYKERPNLGPHRL